MAFVNQRRNGGNALQLGMVAAVVANVSGLMTGGLYLFLKSKTLSTIGPRDKVGEYENRRQHYKIRHQPSELDFDAHITRPVGGQGSLRRTASDASLLSLDKEMGIHYGHTRPVSSIHGQEPNPLRSNSVYPLASMPKPPEPAQLSNMPSAAGHMRKRSYSLFPNDSPSVKSVAVLPSTTYNPNPSRSAAAGLKPPPSMGNLTAFRHRRDSSQVSSATVQIGLRFSNVNDMPPVTNQIGQHNNGSVYSLECPLLKQQDGQGASLKRPTPLNTMVAKAPSDDGTLIDENHARDPAKDANRKTLPPVPALGEESQPPAKEEEEEVLTLSPTVYTPPSPAKPRVPDVGYTLPTSKYNASSPRSPPMRTPPPRRTTGDDTPRTTNAKGDWI